MRFIPDFFKAEAASSLVLMAAAVLAMIAANSPLSSYYQAIQSPQITFFINDGLMAIFFLLIGIEIKHEIREGELSEKRQLLLPLACAIGGVVVPALIFCALNWNGPNVRGWAIPSATDIAFSLGVLALFGRKVSPSLKIFLMAVAVIDDLIAVVIIAGFYTRGFSYPSLALAALCIALLYFYARRGIERPLPYLFAGCALWVVMTGCGIHATIAGAIIGLLLPPNLAKKISHLLHPFVAFGIIPIFAFFNAGIPLSGIDLSHATDALPLGIIVGLLAGKPIGIVLAALILVRLGFARLPAQANWLEFLAVAALAGIGFTLSLFIGALAFNAKELTIYIRFGVIVGSLASAIVGCFLMRIAVKKKIGTI